MQFWFLHRNFLCNFQCFNIKRYNEYILIISKACNHFNVTNVSYQAWLTKYNFMIGMSAPSGPTKQQNITVHWYQITLYQTVWLYDFIFKTNKITWFNKFTNVHLKNTIYSMQLIKMLKGSMEQSFILELYLLFKFSMKT